MDCLRLSCAMLLLAASGCSSTTAVRLPDGQRGFAIACGGEERNWAKCYEAAGSKCGSEGYDIINPGSEQSGSAAGQSLLFKCRH